MICAIVLNPKLLPTKLKWKILFPRARVHIQLGSNPSGRTSDKAIFLESLKNTAQRYRLFKEPSLQAIARIEASLLSGARKYFEENLFVEVTVPHVTRATGACENVATMFEVDFFGEKRYLAQTGQLYLEVMTPYLERVWAAGPSFRAEEKVDERHLVEFTLLEIEFRGNFEKLLEHVEGTLVSMVSEVLAKRSEDLAVLGVDAERLQNVRGPFKRITYTDAVELLEGEGVRWGDDLKSPHEKLLVEYMGSQPLFITHYPKAIKFFNMKENAINHELVDSADLILPYSGEAVGAAEREYEYDRLVKRLLESSMFRLLKERGGGMEDFAWYLNFYKEFGGYPHSGCGIGLGRVMQFVLGVDDIRGSTVWPVNREAEA
jgi:asparaginyl-tRNA synthetase